MKKLSDTVIIFAVASVLAGIPAIVEAVQRGGTDRVGNVDAWTYNFFSRVPNDKPYLIYDDYAHEVWSKLNQINFLTIEYVNRFYGQDIIITFDQTLSTETKHKLASQSIHAQRQTLPNSGNYC